MEKFQGPSPDRFWRCLVDLTEEQWHSPVSPFAPLLQVTHLRRPSGNLLLAKRGKGKLGSNHKRSSLAKREYFALCPALLRNLTPIIDQQFGAALLTALYLAGPESDYRIASSHEGAPSLIICLAMVWEYLTADAYSRYASGVWAAQYAEG